MLGVTLVRRIFLSIFFLAFIAATAELRAESASNFQSGKTAFENKQFARAIEFFHKVLISSPENQHAAYNLAVSYYRLQRWTKAQDQFSRLTKIYPENTLYRYNLAIIAKKLGENSRAINLFRGVVRADLDTSLADLARRQLQLLGSVAEHRNLERSYKFRARASVGFEDGLIDPAEQRRLNEASDHYIETFVYARLDFLKNASSFWSLQAQYQKTDFSSLDSYDLSFKVASVSWQHNWSDTRLAMRVMADQSELGHENYLDSVGAEVRFEKDIASNRRLTAVLRARKLDSKAVRFDPLQGNQFTAYILADVLSGSNWRWRLSYNVERNSREDIDFGYIARDYSPLRQAIASSYVVRKKQWLYTMRFEYRNSRYNSENVDFDGRAVWRNDDRFRVEATATWDVLDTVSVEGRYRYTESHSTIDRFDYTHRLVELGVIWKFDKPNKG